MKMNKKHAKGLIILICMMLLSDISPLAGLKTLKR